MIEHDKRDLLVRLAAGDCVEDDPHVRQAMDGDPAFAAAMNLRGIDVDYRPGSQLRVDLWREYKSHTEILRRIGMIKQ